MTYILTKNKTLIVSPVQPRQAQGQGLGPKLGRGHVAGEKRGLGRIIGRLKVM